MDFDTNVSEGKDTAFPLFYMQPVEMTYQSKQEGRPVFRDTEFVKIMLPGFKDISVHKVRPEDIQRWPEQYKKFKEGNDTSTIIGTPITEWNGIKPSQAAACKSLNILSVEALANLPDAPLRKLGPDCYDLQKRAKDFLASAHTNARISALEAQLAAALKENEALKAPKVESKPEPVIVPSPEIPVKAVEKTSTEVSSKTVTHPDGRTWSGRGRKPNWVKELEGK